MLVSVHMPKTAGTSFRAALSNHFGPSMRRDEDRPMMQPAHKRQRQAMVAGLWLDLRGVPSDIACVHGHLLPVKYLLLASRRDIRFVTWLREPVDRMLSHYFYMMRSKPTNPLAKRMHEESWTVSRFALGPELRNFYHQYFWGFPVDRFDFIGVQEHYSEDLQEFSERFLGAAPTEVRTNVGTAQAASVSSDLRAEIAAHHAADVALYARVVERRRERVGEQTS